jgi:hypothetical protein
VAPVKPQTSEEPVAVAEDREGPANMSTRYLIDDQPVDRETWEAFRASTTRDGTTWYCDDASWGGEEGWNATDADGHVYRVTLTTDFEQGSTMSITRESHHRRR